MSNYRHIALPGPKNDEMLHSVLIEGFRESGYPDFREFTRLIFGRHTDGRGWPWSYTRIAPYLSPNAATARAVLERTLTLPYYVPFIPPAVLDLCLHAEGQPAVPCLPPRFRLGSHALRKAGKPLRFCVACVRDDVRHDGLSYWRRAHQLDHVTVCWLHRVPLREWRQPERYPLLPHEIEVPLSEVRVLDDDAWLAFQSKQLMDSNYPASPCERQSYAYCHQAARIGFGKPSRISASSIGRVIRQRYSEPFLLRIFGRCDGASLKEIVQQVISSGKSRTAHPVAHLVCIEVLFGDLRKFFSDAATAPFDRCEEGGETANLKGKPQGLHRRIFAAALEKYGGSVMAHLRAQYPATYAWVKLQDRRWAPAQVQAALADPDV